MNVRKKIGFLVLTLILLSYFIPIEIESGANYAVNTKLLWVLCLFNPFLLGIYLLAGIIISFYPERKNRIDLNSRKIKKTDGE